MPTLFSRIISWEIPSYKLYEDEYTYAFLDIFPQQPGHTLIVPKVEVDHFSDVPEPYYSAIFQTAKKLSKAIEQATGCTRVCTAFLGFQVSHCHYQLLPIMNEDEFVWKQVDTWQPEDLKSMQEKILSFLD